MWRKFRFVFATYASAAHPGMPALFRQSESIGGRPIDADDLEDPTTALSRQLYYMLVMLATDDAHRLMSNVEQGSGAEAWSRLRWEYEPDVGARHGAAPAQSQPAMCLRTTMMVLMMAYDDDDGV